jgi:Flp pilus assembly pilin Flp
MSARILVGRGISVARPAPVRTRLGALLHRLHKAESGATLIEFALVLPPLLLLVIGMFEVATAMFVSTSVESALREASRYGITGSQPANGQTRQQQILQIIRDHTFGFLDPATTAISFKTYASFQDVGQPEPFVDTPPPGPLANGKYDPGENFTDLNGNGQWDADRGTNGVGNAGDVVQYKVDYDWHLMTPFLSQILGNNGVLHMSASLVVRNEPYSLLQTTGG